MLSISLLVNGKPYALNIPAETRLAEALRDSLAFTGTNQACDTAQCGACTVLVDGKAVKSCNVLAAQMQDRTITTIEGLSQAGQPLHVMQQAFIEHEALQCGYCTPGMILRAISMEAEGIVASPAQVRHALAGNICRCTGYDSIVKAVCSGLTNMRA